MVREPSRVLCLTEMNIGDVVLDVHEVEFVEQVEEVGAEFDFRTVTEDFHRRQTE